MKAVILAAGEGHRMRPLTYTRPKVMLPIANKPILEHLLIEAGKAGIRQFIFIVGYHDEQVRQYFGSGDRWKVKIDYCTQRKQLGTADALRMVEGLVEGNFLMLNGDIVVDHKDIAGLINGKVNTMSVVEVEDTRDLGMVELREGRVVHIYEKVEKAPSHMANAGLYLFTPEMFVAISRTAKSPRGEYEITDSLQWLIDQGSGVSYQKIDYWLDLSYPWELLPANESLLAGIEAQNLGEVEENVVMKGVVSVGKGTTVKSGAYIVGPVLIGQNCEI
ncbi:MAG: NTP transferase domain-containing protein, partial [Chloroflexi bacterium]|nr:NTP transferase domain-containing protein [Chloroflexota bacterium]